jgi:hypothetical protein
VTMTTTSQSAMPARRLCGLLRLKVLIGFGTLDSDRLLILRSRPSSVPWFNGGRQAEATRRRIGFATPK